LSVLEVDLDEAIRLRDAGSVVVDVRESFEWDAGHVAGARHIPLGQLADRMASDLPDRAAPLLLTATPARDPGGQPSTSSPMATRMSPT
jgi:rhodanese-related sulfurtransferase